MADGLSSNLPASTSQGVTVATTTSTPTNNNNNNQTPTKLVLDKEEYSIRKRLPPNLPKRNNDVYVTNKTAFKAQLDRCKKLIDQGENELYLHSLGAAIPRALNLALQIQKAYGIGLTLETATSTVELTDDFEPLHGEGSEESRIRYNSSIHIKILYNPEAKDRENAEAASANQQEP
jgi:ribonuclease P/MRP protein subunit RPP20